MSNRTRQQLVETTSRLLERQGYHGTGLNQIVRESGAPRGSLYYYFPEGKEALVAAALAEQGDRMRRFTSTILSEIEDAVEAVDRVVERLIEFFSVSEHCGGAPLAAVALETSASSERLRTTCADAYQGLIDVFAQKLTQAGYPLQQAQVLATTIVAGIEGAVILSRTQQSTLPMEQVRAALHTLLTQAALAQRC
ncbi:MAG: TetR/AcrR family transcriptional regulator [Caldilinea sp.]|nr:TetR/AcrR family transcriptional regulator [Caldilinea sp.]MDW8439882.1 TetR/AcrR family transcriptional regulator [Caldilineaceae bacterium]